MNDLTIIKLFMSDREVYQNYKPQIRMDALEREAQIILDDLGLFYETVTESSEAGEKFITWFNQVKHPDLSESKRALYNALFERIKGIDLNSDPKFINNLIDGLKKEALRSKMLDDLEMADWDPGAHKEMLEKYEKEIAIQEDDDFEINDPDVFCEAVSKEHGLKWRLHCLQKTLGSLVEGEFGVVAAAVNTGKSAFLVSEASNFAQQLTEGSVLWFTTEQTPKQVLIKLWAATLEVPMSEVSDNRASAKAEYIKRMHGDIDRIKVIDATGFDTAHIARKILKYRPKLVIVDMIDHIVIKGNSEAADWRMLQRLYHSLRMLARTCPILGSSQCDASTSGISKETGKEWYKKYIGMKQLEGAKVGKQGAVDFLITIGIDELGVEAQKKADPRPSIRYICVPKSKTHKTVESEAVFDFRTMLFTDYDLGDDL